MLISVITVTKNDLKGLKFTFESVCSQTYSSLEYIIVDGGSTDGTTEFLLDNAKFTFNLISGKDNGIYDAMNKGIDLARGNYLIFMNSGDSFFDNSIVERVAIVLAQEESDVLYGDAIAINRRGSTSKWQYSSLQGHDFLLSSNICQQSIFYSKEALIKAGKFDLTYTLLADYALLLKLYYIANCTFKHIGIPICRYNTEGQTSNPINSSRIEFEKLRALSSTNSPRLAKNIYILAEAYKHSSRLRNNLLIKVSVKIYRILRKLYYTRIH